MDASTADVMDWMNEADEDNSADVEEAIDEMNELECTAVLIVVDAACSAKSASLLLARSTLSLSAAI